MPSAAGPLVRLVTEYDSRSISGVATVLQYELEPDQMVLCDGYESK